MTGDWSQEIKREYSGSDIRFDFPPRRLGWVRLIGLFPLGFGLLFVWIPGHTAWESTQKLLHGSRDVGDILFSVFPLLFVIAGCLPMGIGLAMLFGRSRVEWRDGRLHSTEIVGPFRWTRHLPSKPIRKLEVAAAASSTGNAPPRTIEKFSGIAALYEDGSRSMAALGYPKDWMMAVAQELKTYVESGSISSEPVKVEFVEAVARMNGNGDTVPEQPPGSRVQVEEHGRGIRFVIPPAGLWKGSKGLFLSALFWCGVMCVFTGLAVFGQSKASGHLPTAFWIFIPAFWSIGLGMLAGAVNLGRRRAELTADSDRFCIETTGILGTKRREWARAEIAAVRADASGMKVNDRLVMELQIHPAVGRKAGFLAGRDEAELRWMAAHLRRVLRVPANDTGSVLV